MDATSHTDDASIETEFWSGIAQAIQQTESERQGCYEVEIADEHRVRACPVADVGVSNVDGVPALMLPIPVDGKPAVSIESLIGLSVGNIHMTATVARTERSGGILTVHLTKPETEEIRIPGGEPTTEHLEYLGA